MIIIVEGIDRVGKTTLCNKLSEELHIPLYKHPQHIMNYSSMDNINETDKMSQLLSICDLLHTNMIFDRFHLSDYVYGIIEREYDPAIANKNFKTLNNILVDMNAILVYVKPTDIVSSSIQHGKDLTPYYELMNKAIDNMSNILTYMCDYNSIDTTIERIKEIYNGTI